MSNIPTPHIEARKDQIAKTVLMPGDPLRAKFIAETFLTDAECVNTVRNMLAYTGYYHGKRVTVFAHGMGAPSIGIYSYELFNFYDVDTIIRIGTAGSMSPKANVRDTVVAIGASTDSNFASQYGLNGTFSAICDFDLARKAVETAERLGIKTVCGNVVSQDAFYYADETNMAKWQKMGILCAEMEVNALYCNAAYSGKKALALLTISDNMVTGEELSSAERQTSFTDMMKIALEIA